MSEINLSELNSAIAETVPDREAIVFRDRRVTYREFDIRTSQLANILISSGFGCYQEREFLEDWQSGQDHIGLYLYNGNEYLEATVACYKSRAVPFNINFRYVDEELIYLLNNAQVKVLVYHSSLAERVANIRDQIPTLSLLIQVNDEPKVSLLEGALDYEEVLSNSKNETPVLTYRPDDLYMIYTGGTTGMPKGVIWRQSDMLVAALGGRTSRGKVIDSLEEFQERAKRSYHRYLASPPFMHGAGSWVAMKALHSGSTVVIQSDVSRLNGDDIIDTCIREDVDALMIVGDAFGRPIVDALSRKPRSMPSLKNIITGGAITTSNLKTQMLELLPHINIIDAAGSSETGTQAQHLSNKVLGAKTGEFTLQEGNAVLSSDMTSILDPGHEGLGWWAQTGHIPLGYLGDEEKTAKTFVTIDGVRYSVPGDRVCLLEDGTLELHGRDSVTINSGGEKIFVEEVEQALKHHPAVYDVVVTGRASDRWGQEVVAVVQLRLGTKVSEESLLQECSNHISRYKYPKAFVFRDEIIRNPSGKADYRWAAAQVSQHDVG